MDTTVPVPSGEMLIHLGFALVGISYFVRNAVRAKLLSVLTYGVFAVAVVLIRSPAMETLLTWYAVFVSIALASAWWMLRERRPERLTAEERLVHERALEALDVAHARRLMRAGRWLTLEPGYVLTLEGHEAMHVFLVLDGSVRVSVAGRHVAVVGAGQFVGEIGLIAGTPATATAVAGEDGLPVRALVWRREDLAREMRESPALRAAVLAALGPDLARKLAAQNTQARPAALSGDAAAV
jgi:CRP-like cAMP-binding protein